jgi:hypothetical protein
MSLPKNGAAVHFILSDSILSFFEIPNLVCINGPVYKRFERWRNIFRFRSLTRDQPILNECNGFHQPGRGSLPIRLTTQAPFGDRPPRR